MKTDDLVRIRRETGCSAVLSLQHDLCLAHWRIDFDRLQNRAVELGVVLVRCPIRDFDVEDMRRQLPHAVATLAALQSSGHRTYVHCTAGLGRAPLVVLTYLILVERLDPEDAISMILAGRPAAVPAWEAYRGCRHDLVEHNRGAIARRAYQLSLQGTNRCEDADWLQAETEVLREDMLTHRNGMLTESGDGNTIL